MTQAYPLQWPEGWPRTPVNRQTQNNNLRTTTFAGARESIFNELRRLGATNVVLSTNVPLRNDGMPHGGKWRIDDPGVAVYFWLGERRMSMARDAYQFIEQNLRSLALAIEYLRGLDRHGGAYMLERAFSGFTALPPPEGHKTEAPIVWREELGVGNYDLPNADLLAICESRYRDRAKKLHPDQNHAGDATAMIRLNLAIKLAREELA